MKTKPINSFLIVGIAGVLIAASYAAGHQSGQRKSAGLELTTQDFNCDAGNAVVNVANGPVDWVVVQAINLGTTPPEVEPDVPDWTKAEKVVGNVVNGTVTVTDVPHNQVQNRIVVWSVHKHSRTVVDCAK